MPAKTKDEYVYKINWKDVKGAFKFGSASGIKKVDVDVFTDLTLAPVR